MRKEVQMLLFLWLFPLLQLHSLTTRTPPRSTRRRRNDDTAKVGGLRWVQRQ
ncbi:hypothetical protein CDL15_Pgr006572 [Punica granatum]|uniref:Uncharacterized protein n=1 Tax=Punica granatum TaxID=22663 RepID=A0A218Y0D1_PUNGR|nr:hypothetical protein CDL15_Pgr006572 [Punica granatum]